MTIHRFPLLATIGVLLASGALTIPAPGVARQLPAPAATRIAGGTRHSVFLTAAGTALGTGANYYGQLTGPTNPLTVPTRLRGLPAGVHAASVAARTDFTIVLGSNGLVYGSGSNSFGQLTGNTLALNRLTRLTGLPRRVRAIAVAAGGHHTVVLGDDGVAYGTGDNEYGQLTGTARNHTTLTPLTGLPTGVHATALAAGSNTTLVLGDDGNAYGTGDNQYGQLTGEGPSSRRLYYLDLPPSVGRVVGIGSGYVDSYVIGDDGVVYGAGNNAYEQLTPTTDHTRLSPLSGLPSGVRAAEVTGGLYHSLVLGDDGVVYGAGDDDEGQITGRYDHYSLTPLVGLPIGVRAVEVTGGSHHSLVLGDDGVVYGTGENAFGQLTGPGDGSNDGHTELTPLGAQPLVNTTRPRISGIHRYGHVLSARRGRWSPVPARYTYRWLRNGHRIRHATHRRYRVRRRDRGARLKVRVVAHRRGFRSAHVMSRVVRIHR